MHERALPLISSAVPRCPWWHASIKDLIGRPLAALALIALSPLFLVLAVLVLISSGRPVFHRRRVVGQGGDTFDALKFRTMVANADQILANDEQLRSAFSVQHKLVEDPRVTRVGRFLRKYSLDELPQLINIVRGEMWLVGPRMISPDELAKYGRSAPKLVSVKPGITGLWQVSGRQETSYERRVELDMQYIDRWSVAGDLRIVLRTFGVVLSGRGAH
jgi:lipopolysaccharide/colanic/teichoic acid biosynthesis glycosyltransferase